MSKSGVSREDVIDFVMSCEHVFRLGIYEKKRLDELDAFAMQRKMAHYLRVATDPRLLRIYPEAAAKQKCILIDLDVAPCAYVMEVLGQWSSRALASRVAVEVTVAGTMILNTRSNLMKPLKQRKRATVASVSL
ncbi:hypothetical protein [Methylovorus mays]|uniref:hypothetical protein n=1 Tax=Methylovorus mays TaxID=184077 RepID=UPI001E29C11A|nr:hypothetical protein [Methylovorus mays]MCB5206670.1 hypothetical protein [Methylovorus mays]